MSGESDRWPLDLLLLGICGNDYESLEVIRDALNESHPGLLDAEVIASLRQLQARGWMQCYRYVLERTAFDPVTDFTNEHAGELWWASTEAGIGALKSSKEWNALDASDDA